jgi:hypothetical protein
MARDMNEKNGKRQCHFIPLARRQMKPVRQSIIFTVLLVLSGCSLATSAPSAVPGLVGFEGLSVIGTQKTLTDHLVSLSSGKDCSTIRRDRGLTYCVEDEVTTPEEVYCYSTLGNVTCYNKPQPDGSAVGHMAPGAGQPR